MTDETADSLDDLPPSAKLVYKVLEYDGPLTQKQLVEESMLSARTVRYALERLQNLGVVSEDIYFADARQNLYQVTADAADAGEPAEATDGGEVADADAATASSDCEC